MIVQIVVMTAYTLIFIEFTTRYLRDRPLQNGPWRPFARLRVPKLFRRKRAAESGSEANSTATQVDATNDLTIERGTTEERNAKLMLVALGFCTIFIFIRSVRSSRAISLR